MRGTHSPSSVSACQPKGKQPQFPNKQVLLLMSGWESDRRKYRQNIHKSNPRSVCLSVCLSIWVSVQVTLSKSDCHGRTFQSFSVCSVDSLQVFFWTCTVCVWECVCRHVLTSIWILSPEWSSEQRSSSVVGWAAPAWRRCGAPHRPSTGFYRPDSSPCWNPAASPASQSVRREEETTLRGPHTNNNSI